MLVAFLTTDIKQAQENIEDFLELVSTWIAYIGIFIMLFGIIKSLISILVDLIKKGKTFSLYHAILELRFQLGIYILLALDFMLAADIIRSLISQVLKELLILGIVVIIRILISYFTDKEIKNIEDQQQDSPPRL